MIRSAKTEDSDVLTKISFASKGYWKYPKEYFEIWRNELTINENYIQGNDVFVYENYESIIGYYSIVNLEKDIEISGVPINRGIWLEHMFIDPKYIGKGIGTKLFNHMREYPSTIGGRTTPFLQYNVESLTTTCTTTAKSRRT